MGIFGNDETDYEKYYDKGGSYLKKGNLEKALEYYDKALEINPNYIDALVNQGFALLNLGIFNEALNCYDKILAIDPNQAVALLNKGIIFLDKLKDYEEALNCYDILLNMDKRVFKDEIEEYNINYPHIYVNIYNDKSLALFNLKRYEEAISCYNESLKIDPNNIDALNGKELAEKEVDNRQTYGNTNENFNYQHIENPLIKKHKAQESKNSFMSILDIITNISIIIFFVALIGTCSIVFTGLYESYATIIYGSFILSIVIIVISSIISDGAKEVVRQKIMKTGIPAQARILKVNNLEFNHVTRIGIAELILEVYPKAGASYNAKSTVNVGVSDASLIFRPGKTIQVFVNPEDTSQIEVEY